MSIVFFEDLMEEEVGKIPEISINSNISRKPSFGWGNTDDLARFLEHHQEKHNPLIWSVPKEVVDSGLPGIFRRSVELNLCVVESDVNLLNEVRLNPNRSFKRVLKPLWEHITNRFAVSNITMTTEIPSFQLFPNFKLGDEFEQKFIWDIMKVKFNVNYSEKYSPCNSY